MPQTHDLQIVIDNQVVEIGELASTGVPISYSLEDPENFEQKQAAMSLDITVPATPANDRIFNSFHDPNVEDMSGDDRYTNPRPCEIKTGWVTVLKGKMLLQNSTYTRLPGSYNIDCGGQNGDWLMDMKDLTVWDCLSDTPHTFDVATVEKSWKDAAYGGYDSDEHHDYVYAPVRYRQPFGENDDTVNIYHLRPSISNYWLIIRAFRIFGYSVSSEFLNTAYFRRMVLPWVWGDFYDINGQIIEGLKFKAVGRTGPYPTGTVDTSTQLYTGAVTDPAHTQWQVASTVAGYVTNFIGGGGNYQNFFMDNTIPPAGFDNLNLYTFTSGPDIMRWVYSPPISLSSTIGNNITANFTLNLIAKTVKSTVSANLELWVEVTKTPAGGGGPTITLILLDELSSYITGTETKGNLLSPTPCPFTITGINIGDTLDFRLKYDLHNPSTNGIIIISSGYVNTAPSGTPHYEQVRSSFTLDNLQVVLGGAVNFRNYDKFRNYPFLDLLRGNIDAFNLSIQTNPIDKVVTIEPTNDYVLPDGSSYEGYFKGQRVDWTAKQDVSKEGMVDLYSDVERQFDFQFKQDGSDGGQNIYAARYKNIYLNNTITNKINNTNIENGIIAGVPGAARYMFPQRFQKGNRQMINRFFSATMHYKHAAWANITGAINPAPQLIAIIPENVSDTSASAISQTFEPKIAYYKGLMDPGSYGAWRWIGDPAAPYSPGMALSFPLPFMFSVNYGHSGETDPVLTYCDQRINGNAIPGLLKTFFLKRMAIMRHGRQLKPWMSLSLADVTDWEHRNKIVIKGGIYHLTAINNYNPLKDDSCECALWKVVNPQQVDLDNVFPSRSSVMGQTGGATLGQFDLKYEQLLLFGIDLPQI